MSKAIQIRIPEPCQENWHNMTPTEQGRFCGSCQKTVVDFTLMTDKELLDYFSKASPHTCGRFSNDQLNKDLKPTAIKKRFSWAYVWNIMLATFLITETNAQVKPVKKKTPELQLPDCSPRIGTVAVVVKEELTPIRELQGVAINKHTRERLAGASILIKGTSIGTVADSLGKFSLPVDMKRSIELTVSYVGFRTQTVLIDSNTTQDTINLLLDPVEMEEVITTGMVVVAYKVPKKKAVNDWKPSIFKKDIKIYPNPVVKGNNIQANLSLKQAGEYKMELLNVQGEVMAVQRLEMMTKEQAVTIPTQSSWAPGIYLVRISAPGVKNVYQCKVSIQ